MAMRLEKENVRIIMGKLLDDMFCFEPEGKEAEKTLCYYGGVIDMANAVMRAIDELGGK